MATPIKIFSAYLHSLTAGLSPHKNERVELFFAGCKMARDGNPCNGCFNQDLWYDDYCHIQTAEDIVSYIKKMTKNKYITIVGGEPLDQEQGLIELLQLLDKEDFHIVLITHYTIDEVNPNILQYTDIVIDGKYDSSKRIFDTDTRPGVHHVVGSSNQKIWYRNSNNYYIDITNKEDLTEYYYKKKGVYE